MRTREFLPEDCLLCYNLYKKGKILCLVREEDMMHMFNLDLRKIGLFHVKNKKFNSKSFYVSQAGSDDNNLTLMGKLEDDRSWSLHIRIILPEKIYFQNGHCLNVEYRADLSLENKTYKDLLVLTNK